MRYLIALALLMGTLTGKGAKLTYQYVDSLSYQYFICYEYPELIHLGEDAIDQGIDFYYLRSRVGIACYKLTYYEKAWKHLAKAMDLDAGSQLVAEYLYWSYRFTGQDGSAGALMGQYPDYFRSNEYNHNGRLTLNLESGYLLTGNESAYKGKNLPVAPDNYTEGSFFTNMKYGRLYAGYKVFPTLEVFGAAGYFKTEHLSKVDFFDEHIERTRQNNQFQFNAGGCYSFAKNFKAGLGLGYYNEQFSFTYLQPPPGSIKDSSTRSGALSVSTYFAKRVPYFEPFVSLSYSNFEQKASYQAGGGITLYPLGSGRLFVTSSLIWKTSPVSSNQGLVFHEKAGFTNNRNFSAEVNYLYGKLDNYVGDLGLLTYNTFDPIKWLVGVNAGFTFRNVVITPAWIFQQREGTTYRGDLPYTLYTATSVYNCQLFILSLTWKL